MKPAILTALLVWLVVVERPPERPGIPNIKGFMEHSESACLDTERAVTGVGVRLLLGCASGPYPDDATVIITPGEGVRVVRGQ